MNSSMACAPWSPCLRLRTDTLPSLRFAIAHHQHVGDLLQLRVADLEIALSRCGRPARAQIRPSSDCRSTFCAYSSWRSVIGSTIACTGASHTGNAPA